MTAKKRFVIYQVAGSELCNGYYEYDAEGAVRFAVKCPGEDMDRRVSQWVERAGRGQHYAPTPKLLLICTAGRARQADEEPGPVYPYLFVINDTKATIRDICREAGVRYQIGPSIDSDDHGPWGMYVHADDLRQLKRFFWSTGQRAEAGWVQEVIALAAARKRSLKKAKP